jgi:hypothetical protein
MRSYAQSVSAVNASTPRKNGKEPRDSNARARNRRLANRDSLLLIRRGFGGIGDVVGAQSVGQGRPIRTRYDFRISSHIDSILDEHTRPVRHTHAAT